MSKEKKIYNIIGRKKLVFGISIVLIIISICATFFGVDVAIEFKGGTVITYSYDGDAIDTNDAKAKIEEIAGSSVRIQQGDLFDSDRKSITVSFVLNDGLTAEKQIEITDALSETYSDKDVQLLDSSDVSPSSGKQFFMKCIVAVVLSSILLVIYIAIRFKRISGWSAGVFAVCALLHDVIITYGAFIIIGFEINSNFMAVVLTILGYSINNTIVIYDRIRENQKLMGKVSMPELVNTSISQSLSRSINTSLSSIITMSVVSIVAYLNNVDSILSLSVPIIVGMLIGTFSSLCLVPNLWVAWQTRNDKNKKN